MPFYGFCSRAKGRPSKVSIIRNLMPPTIVKGIRSFLGHARFYLRFIRDFSKIARPLCKLLEKDTNFYFDESCHNSFEEIKSSLVELPSWQNQIGTENLKSCVIPVNLQWELYCDRKLKKYSRPYTMPAKPLTKLRKITLLLKRRCWR